MTHSSRRRFLIGATAGLASLTLSDLAVSRAAPLASGGAGEQGRASALPTLSDVFSGNPGSMTVVNYARYVPNRARVDASRAEHQVYADALRTHNRLVMGGPLLGDDGRPSGVLLIYQVASKQQAERLVQSDPFVQQGAVEHYRLDEWSITDKNVDALTAALVPEDQRAGTRKPPAPGATLAESDALPMRTYVHYTRFVSDHSKIELARAAHRAYVRGIQASGKLIIGGAFADDSGGLFIYRARSKEEAMKLLVNDPYYTEGVFGMSVPSEWRMFGLNAELIQPG
jgi:uncharacterized protein YciI